MSQPFGEPWYRRLLEIQGLLGAMSRLSQGMTREDYDQQDVTRWAIHRLWIAVGTEAGLYRFMSDAPESRNRIWAVLYKQRNDLAHQPLPAIDENAVWRTTALRLSSYQSLVARIIG